MKNISVLNHFYIGLDNEERLIPKIDFNTIIVDIIYDKKIIVKKITVDDYFYKGRKCKVIFLLINDVLVGVKYYPPKNGVEKYIKIIQKIFDKNIENQWVKENVVINLDTLGVFNHYISYLPTKYPDYLDF